MEVVFGAGEGALIAGVGWLSWIAAALLFLWGAMGKADAAVGAGFAPRTGVHPNRKTFNSEPFPVSLPPAGRLFRRQSPG